MNSESLRQYVDVLRCTVNMRKILTDILLLGNCNELGQIMYSVTKQYQSLNENLLAIYKYFDAVCVGLVRCHYLLLFIPVFFLQILYWLFVSTKTSCMRVC